MTVLKNKNKKLIIFLVTVIFVVTNFFIFPTQVFGQDDDVVGEINEKISEKRKEIDQLKEQIELYQQEIVQKQSEAVTLKNQLAILENQIKKTELSIEETEAEIEKLSLEIESLNYQIKQTEEKISQQKQKLAEFIRLIYQNDQVSYLEVLLLNDSFSEFFNQLEYMRQLHSDLQDTLDKLQSLKAELEVKKAELETKKQEEEDLKVQLEEEKADLEERLTAKEMLLIETKRSEIQFKNYVYQLKLEQQQINAEIATLERKVREELQKREFAERFKGFGPARFIWPVLSRYVTAYFHDPDYPYRYIFEHPAIDIRASQGTPIKAAESGYVARAKDAGMGYSYIMIIHNDGFSTVYGHVSRIDVSDDEYVSQGQIIGLSGGQPGTPGAGRLTTAPHLHFEVRLDGIPVNPLEYLP